MNRSLIVTILLLVLWIILSGFWYTCKVKGVCISLRSSSIEFRDNNTNERQIAALQEDVYDVESNGISDIAETKIEDTTAELDETVIETETITTTPPPAPVRLETVKCPSIDWNATVPTISDLRFGFNSSVIQCQTTLKEYAASIKAYLEETDGMLVLTGHTDIGSKEISSFALGLKRANELKKYFIKQGIPGNRIKTLSKGETQPVADNDTYEGRKQNRRVSININ